MHVERVYSVYSCTNGRCLRAIGIYIIMIQVSIHFAVKTMHCVSVPRMEVAACRRRANEMGILIPRFLSPSKNNAQFPGFRHFNCSCIFISIEKLTSRYSDYIACNKSDLVQFTCINTCWQTHRITTALIGNYSCSNRTSRIRKTSAELNCHACYRLIVYIYNRTFKTFKPYASAQCPAKLGHTSCRCYLYKQLLAIMVFQ
ncbi:hypothetical protein D3C77_465440 [compost metagenome]